MENEIVISEGLGKFPPKTSKKLSEADAVERIWTRTPVESKTVTVETPALTPWQWATAILSVFAITFFIGYVSKDTFIQDRIENVQRLEAVKRNNAAEIQKLQKSTTEAEAKISKISEELKTRGISYQSK